VAEETEGVEDFADFGNAFGGLAAKVGGEGHGVEARATECPDCQ
jgi:hypothetical protein